MPPVPPRRSAAPSRANVVNLLPRGAAPGDEVSTANVWLLDRSGRTADVTLPMPSTALERVRGVPGVAWAAPLIRAGATIRTPEGKLEPVSVIGGRRRHPDRSAAPEAGGTSSRARRPGRGVHRQRRLAQAVPDGGAVSTRLELNDQRGAGLAGPLLDFGRVGARIDQRQAEAREAFAAYRGALFTALGDAEAALGALSAADRRVAALERQAAIDRDAVKLARERYRRGLDTLLIVIDAERTAFASRANAIDARADASRARVALYRAVGGTVLDDRPGRAPSATSSSGIAG